MKKSMNRSLIVFLIATFLVGTTPSFAMSMEQNGTDDAIKTMEKMDAQEPRAKDMKMDEKAHTEAIKKARTKYEAALKKAQLVYVRAIKKIGREKARKQLDKAKKDALTAYTRDKKDAMKKSDVTQKNAKIGDIKKK